MIGFGVPAGANSAITCCVTKFGTPPSTAVDISGATGMRFGLVMANRRSLPVRWNSRTWLVIAGTMIHGSRAGGAVSKFARIGPHIGHQLLEAVNGYRWIDNNGVIVDRHYRHRCQFLHRIEQRILAQNHLGEMDRGAAKKDRVAVGWRMRDELRGERSARARLVIYED